VYITPEEIALINCKITLTLKKAALLMNISEQCVGGFYKGRCFLGKQAKNT